MRGNMRGLFLKRAAVKPLLTAIAAVFFLSASSGEDRISVKKIEGSFYVSLFDAAGVFGIESIYDPVSDRVKIYHNENTAVINPGFSFMIFNGLLHKYDNPPLRIKGEVFVPADFFLEFLSRAFAGRKVGIKGDFIIVSGEKEPVTPGKKSVKPGAASDRITFIVIDPGHGGKDPGAIGKGGLKEKTLTLEFSRVLEKKLKSKISGVKIYMTRNSDKFLELYERTDFANRLLKKKENGLFISFHINASISPKSSGFETYFLSQNPSNEDARNTAALENNVVVLEKNAHGKRYSDVDYIEANMLTTQIQKESSMLAESVQKSIGKKVKSIKSRGVKKADFFVLRGVLMPAILVEAGYISNPKEAEKLKKADVQQELAESISGGVADFIDRYNRMLK